LYWRREWDGPKTHPPDNIEFDPVGGNADMNVLIEKSLAAMAALRRQHPRVHCITNNVAQYFSANVLLACGAIPSMTIAVEEIAGFVEQADALLINLGTMDEGRTMAARMAIEVANDKGVPFVLDPVFVQASKPRLALALELAADNPTIIRANAAEHQAMFGDGSVVPKSGAVVISGARDKVLFGAQTITVVNGAPVMTQMTAMGCALTSLMAGLAAVEKDPAIAATAALLWFNIAGEVAAEKSSGPGTFIPHFLDALATMDNDTIMAKATLS
jgi:hydroxyethylthiazole kinase